MKKIKLAATILLGRDKSGELEVLLLRRNKALAFAGGLWVFPGGKIEPQEIEQTESELAAAKLAAVRETKEETDLEVNEDALIFYRHWTTPEVEPRRFATYFFFAEANEAAVQIDDSEIKDHQWISPKGALEKFEKGELAMLPPTFMSLQLIHKCQSVAEVTEFLKTQEPVFVLPVLKSEGSKMIVLYEGDAGYASANPKAEGARHRLIVDIKKGTHKFEYENCESFPAVNGGMHL